MTNAADSRASATFGLNFVLAVVQREHSEDYAEFFRRRGANLVYSYLCEGTAQKKMLNLWGLERKERHVICALCSSETANDIMSGLVSEMRIDAPNEGVAVMLPVESIAGASNASYEPEAGDGEDFRRMVEEMTAGRMAKFFGLTIAEEKEMIYIVTGKDSEEAIVRSIIDRAGPGTEAKAVAFALPVERIAGFSKL